MVAIDASAEKTSFSMDEFCDALRRSELMEDAEVQAWKSRTPRGTDARVVAGQMVKAGLITRFQGNQLLQGKCRGFVIGPYRILDLLNEGKKDARYLAEHRAMNRFVTIKVLKQNVEQGPSNRERLVREARITAALNHPNIVKLFDFDDSSGQQFLVMEYVPGKSLKQLLEEGGPLPVAKALDYARQIAEGLSHAHEKGIIHRDIKPSSLIVDAKGVVKILDMGHCRFSDDQQMNITKMYDPTTVVGSVDYIAPEQAIGEQYDERCDLYSLGATLFTLLTGRAPFLGTSYQILMAHQVDAVPDMKQFQPDVPSAVQALVVKLMAKSPQQRYQSANEVIKALQRLQDTPRHSKIPPLPSRPKSKRPNSGFTLEVSGPRMVITQPAQAVQVISYKKPRRSRNGWFIAGGILALVVVGALLYWLLK